MISEELFDIFNKNDLTFFTGVPDSTFKSWMSFLEHEHGKKLTQIIAANECEAVGIAAGYHLSTGKIGVVYLQNSGEGKTVNPLTSLCDPEVYSIPIILMIGWRGEPGRKDEPQHKKMGRVMIPLLETLEIPYRFLPSSVKDAEKEIAEVKAIALKQNSPVAIIVKKGIIPSENSNRDSMNENNHVPMTREDAIKTITNNLTSTDIIVSTTGKISRELFEYRIERKENPRDFYTVGGMGCAASIALGIALQKSERKVLVFDGDGAVLMQMGSLATIGHYKPANFAHILFDNEAHDSTGGQTTVSRTVDFKQIALACGYNHVSSVKQKEELVNAIKKIESCNGPHMIIVRVRKGARKNLGRPTTTPLENKENFMRFIAGR